MFKKIMVPLDGSELAECVLPYVQTVAETKGVETVVFIRIVEPLSLSPVRGETGWFTEEEMKQIDDRAKAAAESYLDNLVNNVNYGQVAVQKEVMAGWVVELLADYAKKNNVDLIIAATHGRSGVSRWVMGSVADRLLRSVNIPVLLVRPAGCGPQH